MQRLTIFASMKVSILLPYYNAAPWIAETIQSIQDQTIRNWELICINDFSNDSSEDIVRELAENDERIKPFSNETKGIIPALQLALSKASGFYITRMDADDLMPPNRLKLMTDMLMKYSDKTIVTGKVRYFSEGILSSGFHKYEQWVNDRIDKMDHYQHLYRECVVASPNWMARKSELTNIELLDKLQYPEDYDLVFRWFQHGFSIECVAEITLLWRDHPTRTSKTSDAYNQVALFKLKIDWFMTLHGKEKSLGVLGAGTKGKLAVDQLTSHSKDFRWYDLNAQKFNGKVGSIAIEDYNLISEDVLLICIYPSDLKGLEKFLASKGYFIGRNSWYL